MSNNKDMNGIQVLGKISSKEQQEILSNGALVFVAQLHRAFNKKRIQLLEQRKVREQQIEIHNQLPNFLPETQFIRDDPTWKCAHPAPGLVDRRVEITGPVDRKMVINGLKSGAMTYMADFEDSTAPTWENCISGQVNLRDAISRTISFTSPEGKRYFIDPKERLSTLIVRPRGWHLVEKHLLIDGEPCSASLFDFGLYFYHNAHNSLKIGSGPYFYLPKMESHLEARLWNDAFNLAQDSIGMRRGTIRATVLIETIMAAFEMEEILFELREHSSGLNCGRWDYIFSFIKKFRHNPQFILPDRASVSMTVPFMSAYVNLLIKTCHKRGVHAMGGMAAQIPIKDDKQANQAAMDKVRADKWREVRAGHDGTWVAHPALVPIALEAFNAHMPYPNQLFVEGSQIPVTASDLLNTNVLGKITETGIRSNLSVALVYVEAWLRGVGCVPIHNLMEDAATAEIARSQIWQWCRHRVTTSEGTPVTPEYIHRLLDDELSQLERSMGDKFFRSKFQQARDFLKPNMIGEAYPDFLTTLLYDAIVTVDINSHL